MNSTLHVTCYAVHDAYYVFIKDKAKTAAQEEREQQQNKIDEKKVF